MADTSVLEVARATHEEIERYEQATVDLLLSAPASSTAPPSLLAHKLALHREHKVSELLDRIVQRKAQLREFYLDPTTDRAKELQQVSAPEGEDPFAEFHKRLAKVQEFHTKYPQAAPEAFTVDFSSLEAGQSNVGATGTDFVDRMFSGEEMLGKYLDLYLQHDQFSNLKGVRKVSYVLYLAQFDQLVGSDSKVPTQTKKSDAYRQYLVSLRDYLQEYLRKTRPLSDVDAIERGVDTSFESAWKEGQMEGWSKFGPVSGPSGSEATPSAPSTSEQGIWCAACRRMYAKQTVYDAHLKAPKHQKAAARLAASQGDVQASTTPQTSASDSGIEAKWRQVALLEQYVLAYARVVDGVRNETASNIERRAALTEREREAENEAADMALHATGHEAEEQVKDEENEGGDERLYNPLRLPLGWDGKPIPYWLYKLHGLDQEFKCQICSDYVYQGRRAFEKHFQESRHAFGMRALGLPNTKHFYEITEIADALALAEKLKKQGRELAEEQYDAEEVEDEQGNTYSRKTYEMMKRQGLL